MPSYSTGFSEPSSSWLIVGGGVYAIFRHGKAGPNDQEARQHYGAKADPNVTPLGEHVPAEPVAAAHGLTESQSAGSRGRDPE